MKRAPPPRRAARRRRLLGRRRPFPGHVRRRAPSHASQTFAASPAFNGVAVSLGDPGTPLRGAVPLSATATSDRDMVSVTFQRSPAGACTWTTICAPTAAPYTCSWNTAGVTDGLDDLRATALDASGYSRTSAVSSRRVDNTAPATARQRGHPAHGHRHGQRHRDRRRQRRDLRRLRGSAVVGRQWVADLHRRQLALIQLPGTRRPSPTRPGTSAPPRPTAPATPAARPPRTGSWTTPRRAITLTNPGSPIGGTVTLASTTGDGAGSGVTSVAYQYRTSPAGAWTAACSSSIRPASSAAGPRPPTGTYDLRATATDGVGKTTTSAVVSSPPGRQHEPPPRRRPSATPAARCAARSRSTARAPDANSAMASMRFEYKPSAWEHVEHGLHRGRRPRRSPARGTPRRSRTAATTCAASRSTPAGNSRTSTSVTARIVDTPARSPSVTRAGHVPHLPRPLAATATDATRGPSRSPRSSTARPVRPPGRRSAATRSRRTRQPLERRRAVPTGPTTCARARHRHARQPEAPPARRGRLRQQHRPDRHRRPVDQQQTSTTRSTPATPSPSPTARRSPRPRSSRAGTGSLDRDPRARQQQQRQRRDGSSTTRRTRRR